MKNKKRVAIIGNGYVGKAVHDFFKDHFDCIVLDINYCILRGDHYGLETETYMNIREEINSTCELAVICVPTPMSKDGKADISQITSTIGWLDTPQILIKSTIPPQTTFNLNELYPDKNICFSPEYIGEGKYIVPQGKGYPDPLDMKKHEFVIIGGKGKNPIIIGEFFKRVLGADAVYMFTDSTTAELCKYMENAFLATKVTFCNEFYDIAEILGVDYDVLRELWLLDGRIGRSHTAVFKNSRGFGGKCLPKDVNAIVYAVSLEQYTPKLLKTVLEVNSEMVEKSE